MNQSTNRTGRCQKDNFPPKHQSEFPPFRNPEDASLMLFLLRASARNAYRGLTEKAAYFARMAATLSLRRSVERNTG